MDNPTASRHWAYGRMVEIVTRRLPVLPLNLTLTIVMDSHAMWDGQDPQAAPRTIVKVTCSQTGPSNWVQGSVHEQQ